MAVSKGYFSIPTYRFFASDLHAPPNPDVLLELTESDIWSSTSSPLPASSSRISKKYSSPVRERSSGMASSLPVNIPDWSKILKEEYRENRRRDDEDEFEEEGVDDRIPPHEFLARQMARTRIASFSVHEGIGRTLKGRDLSRVRNAIWEKTGFQD